MAQVRFRSAGVPEARWEWNSIGPSRDKLEEAIEDMNGFLSGLMTSFWDFRICNKSGEIIPWEALA